MLQAVLDTDVLVCALWTPAGNALAVLELVFSEEIIPCFDELIINEYRAVLSRQRLAFPDRLTEKLLDEIFCRGISLPIYPGKTKLPHEASRKFYDTAKFYGAYLITGNTRHYPKDPMILSPSQFLKKHRINP